MRMNLEKTSKRRRKDIKRFLERGKLYSKDRRTSLINLSKRKGKMQQRRLLYLTKI